MTIGELRALVEHLEASDPFFVVPAEGFTACVGARIGGQVAALLFLPSPPATGLLNYLRHCALVLDDRTPKTRDSL